MDEKEFAFKFYEIIKIILIVLVIFFIISGLALNEKFFLRFSKDKSLREETLNKIQTMQIFLFCLGFVFFICFILLKNKKEKIKFFLERRKEIIINFLVLIITLMILLIIGEIIIRVLFHNETSTYGFGPGSMKFNEKYVSVNKEGFRDRDFQIDKLNNSYRIVIVGDSYTFGSGIKNFEETFPKILEEILNNASQNKHFEVLNFGMPGTNTEDQIKILKEKSLKYNPDMIILAYIPNDFKNFDENIKESGKIYTLPIFGFWLKDVSYLYYFFESRINKFLENTNLKGTYEGDLESYFNSQINIIENKKAFDELVSITSKGNISLMVISLPMIYHLDNYPFKKIERILLNYSEEDDFKLVSILKSFKENSQLNLVVNKYDSHPNEIAHKIIAQEIFENMELK